jgi:hypothetical protein
MGQSKFNRRSHTPPRASHWEATTTVRGFTADGSGTVSTEAIATNRPRTQIMHDLDFIPACTRVSMITDFSVVFCEGARNGSLAQGQPWNGRTVHLAARVSRFIDAKRNSRIWASGRPTGSWLERGSQTLACHFQPKQLKLALVLGAPP